MSSSGPPADDVPPVDLRTGRPAFAWGESPIPTSELDRSRRRTRTSCVTVLDATRGRVDDHVGRFEGEPGIGKTTLLAAAARAATGFRCLWVRGVESESVLAHAGLLQALGPLRADLAEIPGAQAAALSARARVGTGGSIRPTASWSPRACCRCSPRGPSAHRCSCSSTTCSGSTGNRSAALGFAARRLREDPSASSGPVEAASSPPEFVQAVPVADARRPVRRRRPRSGAGSRLGPGRRRAWSTTRAAIRWRCSRSRDASRTRSGWVPHRCPRRCGRRRPTGNRVRTAASTRCPHRPAGRSC